MNRKSKREIRRAVSTLSENADDGRIEHVDGMPLWVADAPAFTEYLSTRGFVVERERRTFQTGFSDILLRTTPPAAEVFYPITWHYDGPTTPNDAVRIQWDEAAREEAIQTAENPVEYAETDLPENPITVVDGDGWDAVAPADAVSEHLVVHRSEAKNYGLEILGNAPAVRDRDQYDLVEVNRPAENRRDQLNELRTLPYE